MRLTALAVSLSLFACGASQDPTAQGSSDGDSAPAVRPKVGAGATPNALPPANLSSGRSHGTPALGGRRANAVPANARLTWHGGKIVAAARVYNFFWGTAFAGAEADERARYDAFAQAISGSWDFVLPLNQYGISPVSFIGSSVYPADPPAALDDSQLRTTLAWAIKNGYAPAPDANTIFQIFLPAGTSLTHDGAAMCKDFCGYHGSFDDASIDGGESIRYVALPRPDCGGCVYAATTMDRETVIDSHELSEAVTDPDVNNHTLGWYDDKNGEIGDICASSPRSTLKGFMVQEEWSNKDNACVGPKDPTPDFAVATDPTHLTVQRGAGASLKVWATPRNGYAGTVSFSVQAPVGIEVKLPSAQAAANTYQVAALSVDDGLAAGQYTMTFTLGDGTITHDGIVTVQVTEPPHPRQILAAGAESGLDGWQPATASGQAWRIEQSYSSYSGTHRFRSNVPQGYSAGTASFLISPAFDLRGLGTVTLSFEWKAQLEQGYDWFSVYATADNGAHWARLSDVTGQSAGFPAWAPAMALDLSAYVGQPSVRIAFGLQSDASVQGWGIAIDEVSVDGR